MNHPKIDLNNVKQLHLYYMGLNLQSIENECDIILTHIRDIKNQLKAANKDYTALMKRLSKK